MATRQPAAPRARVLLLFVHCAENRSHETDVPPFSSFACACGALRSRPARTQLSWCVGTLSGAFPLIMGKGGDAGASASSQGLRKYTMAQVRTHTHARDCWIVIRGKVRTRCGAPHVRVEE